MADSILQAKMVAPLRGRVLGRAAPVWRGAERAALAAAYADVGPPTTLPTAAELEAQAMQPTVAELARYQRYRARLCADPRLWALTSQAIGAPRRTYPYHPVVEFLDGPCQGGPWHHSYWWHAAAALEFGPLVGDLRHWAGQLRAEVGRARREYECPRLWSHTRHVLPARWVLRARWRSTQAWLRRRGIRGIWVWRGEHDRHDRPLFHSTVVHWNPLSSASWWYGHGRAHAHEHLGADRGRIALCWLPAARIVWTSFLEFDPHQEREAVFLGGPTAAWVWSFTPRHPLPADAPAFLARGAAWLRRRGAELPPPPLPGRGAGGAPRPRRHLALPAAPGAGARVGRGPYQPDPAWWRSVPDGRHGVSHAARVAIWADRVAAGLAADGQPVDRAVVRWAALVHDCRRLHGGDDPEHGARAAAWFGARAAEVAPELTAAQVAAVQHAVTWHVPADRDCPQMTSELQALKDADGLDRVRLGDFDPRYLRTPYLRGEETRARDLWGWTLAAPAPTAGDAVQAAAQRLGLDPRS